MAAFFARWVAQGCMAGIFPLVASAEGVGEIKVSTRLVSPLAIEVRWSDGGPRPAWYAVEWGTSADDEFVILDVVPPDTRVFTHADLMPETPQFYRVRAIVGPNSAAATLKTGEDLTDSEYAARYDCERNFSWTEPAQIAVPRRSASSSVFPRGEGDPGRPVLLDCERMPDTTSGFRLTWVDHASDEDGYLVELREAGRAAFRPYAMLDANINRYGVALTPPVRAADVRVRSYRFSRGSNLARCVTGRAVASGGDAASKK